MNFRIAVFALSPVGVLLALVGSANAQTLNWGATTSFDHGGTTGAAINGAGAGYAVEAHLGGPASGGPYSTDYYLWYDTSAWGNVGSSWHGGFEVPPNGGLATGNTMQISGDPTSSSMLYTLIFNDINQGNSFSYVYTQTGTLQTSNWALNTSPNNPCYGVNAYASHGWNPTIAQATRSNGQMYFFLVENGTNELTTPAYPTSDLNFKWGTLNSDGCSIAWNDADFGDYVATGWNPSIAVRPISSSTFFIALAYQTDEYSTTGQMVMKVGTWQVGNTIPSWSNTYEYTTGQHPHIAICARDGMTPELVEVHNYGANDGVYAYGPIAGWTSWTDKGNNWLPGVTDVYGPSVACNTWWGYVTSNEANGNIFMAQFSFN